VHVVIALNRHDFFSTFNSSHSTLNCAAMETPVTFECKGQQLVGMLHVPDGRGRFPAALLLHGFTASKTENHRMFVKLSRQLASQGIASLRFDFRGSGDSAGDSEDMTIRSEMADG